MPKRMAWKLPKAGGYMAKNEWVYDNNYKSWFYLKADGSYAEQEWQKINGKWYYFKKWGYMAKVSGKEIIS